MEGLLCIHHLLDQLAGKGMKLESVERMKLKDRKLRILEIENSLILEENNVEPSEDEEELLQDDINHQQ